MSPAEVPSEVPVGSAAPAASPMPGRDHAAVSWRPSLLASEIVTLFRRRRTIAMLAGLALVPIMVAVAVRLSSPGDSGGGPAFLARITENGLFVAITAMTVSIPLFLPLTVGVVAGDTIAGEASLGTLRYLLVAPAARPRLLLVKYAGAALFCLVGVLTVAVSGVIIGAILFRVGPVTLLSGDTIDIGGFAARMLLLVAYVTLSMLGLSAIGLFASTLTTVPVGAMAATIVMSTVSQILDNLPQLEAIHPYLFTHYWLGFADLLRNPIAWDSFTSNAILQLAYIAIFGSLAYGRFATKDILS